MAAKMKKAILTSVGSEADVAKRLGVSSSTVGKTRRKHGVKPYGWSEIQKHIARVVALRKKGKTYVAIGEETGIATSTVFKWCMDANLPKVKQPYRRLVPRKTEPTGKVYAAPAEWVMKAIKSAEAAK